MLFLCRFFRVVPPVPSLLFATFAIATVAGAAATLTEPSRAAAAVRSLLLLQLFAAASGFAAAARRGHYDLLLVRGESRARIALVHWGMSVYPGLVCWGVLAAAEALVRGSAGVALATGTMAALWIVSTVPWALTVALPRFAGAIGWLLALSLIGMFTPTSALPAPLEAMIFPAVLIGRDMTRDGLAIVLPAAVLGLAAMAMACGWIHRMSIPLEAAQ